MKMLCAGVLPVSTRWQDVQIVPFLPAILPAVVFCVLAIFSSSDSFSSLLFLPLIAELAAGELEDNNCGKAFFSSLDNSSSQSQVVIIIGSGQSLLRLVSFTTPNHSITK